MEHTGSRPLQTKRLLLRPFCEEDAQAMFRNWASDGEVTKYLTWTPHENEEQTRAILKMWQAEAKNADCYHWAIVFGGEAIGDISVVFADEHNECGVIGYCLSRKFWGRGLMTEALSEVTRYLFEEAGFFRLEAMYSARNPASGRVMEKCGYLYEGTFRKHFKLLSTGERTDIVQRAILREDYFARK